MSRALLELDRFCPRCHEIYQPRPARDDSPLLFDDEEIARAAITAGKCRYCAAELMPLDVVQKGLFQTEERRNR